MPSKRKMNDVEFETVDWQTFYSLCLEAADVVKASGIKYDVLVGISRGGLVPLRILSDELDQKNLLVVRVEFYEDVGKTKLEPTIKEDLREDEIKGLKVLVVDDVADSGKSLRKVVEYLRKLGAERVDTLTIFFKPKSEIVPTFYVRTTNKWIIFPHERRETILKIVEKEKNNKSIEQIRKDLINIGLEPYVIDRVLKEIK